MTEGRRCQVHLLDDRKLELLVQVSSGNVFLLSSVTNECACYMVDLTMGGGALSTVLMSVSTTT